MNLLYRVTSVLLSYPQAELLEAVPAIRARLALFGDVAEPLLRLLDHFENTALLELQQDYVATFDRCASLSLHLFEHVHGESRDRGQAMVDLLQEYQRRGYEPTGRELPDHVPLFLEFLSEIPAHDAQPLLDDAIHVLAALGRRLAERHSPWAAVFVLLRRLARVEPRDQGEPPVRDMDDMLEVFGPGADGVEPLLRPQDRVQPVVFHARPQAR